VARGIITYLGVSSRQGGRGIETSKNAIATGQHEIFEGANEVKANAAMGCSKFFDQG
jgi:hypothetical protein